MVPPNTPNISFSRLPRSTHGSSAGVGSGVGVSGASSNSSSGASSLANSYVGGGGYLPGFTGFSLRASGDSEGSLPSQAGDVVGAPFGRDGGTLIVVGIRVVVVGTDLEKIARG